MSTVSGIRNTMATVALAAAMLAGAVFPESSGAVVIGPVTPDIGAGTPPRPTMQVIAAARRIAGLAGKKRPIPKRPARPAPKVHYGPWRSAMCSWYWEPQPLAGGGYLKPGMMIVAHKTLPFGTRIQFSYHGRTCIAVVMDRGPYVSGREFDLGPGTARALRFDGVGRVSYRLVR